MGLDPIQYFIFYLMYKMIKKVITWKFFFCLFINEKNTVKNNVNNIFINWL